MLLDLFFADHDIGICFGGERNCKTLHGVRMARIAYEHGWPIYSNVSLFSDAGDWRCQEGRIDSEDSVNAIDQLFAIFDRIKQDRTNADPKFLLLDEFSDLADAQKWREVVHTSNIWKQLGKMGFTTFVTNQQLSMTYNRYRDNATRILYTRMMPGNEYYRLIVMKQSVINFKKYIKAYDVMFDARPIFPLYDTYQPMYTINKKG